MTTPRIIPDAYTEYEDGHLGVIPASLANVEAKIGPAESGQPNKMVTLAGPDAKKQAKTIFQGGPLLQAIEAAFDAGSTRIHACRIGSAIRAQRTVKNILGVDTLRIQSEYGSQGNNHWLNISHELNDVPTGYLVLIEGSLPETPHRVIFYNSSLTQTLEIQLPAEINQVVDIAANPIFEQMTTIEHGFAVLGLTDTAIAKIWFFNPSGTVIPGDIIDLTAILDPEEQVRGLDSFDGDDIILCTDQRLIEIDLEETYPPTPGSYWTLSYSALGLVDPDIVSTASLENLADHAQGLDPDDYTLMLDRTAKIVYAIADDDEPPVLSGQVSLASLIPTGTPEKLSYHFFSGNLMLLVREDDESCRLVEIAVDWEADPSPTATLIDETSVPNGSSGLHNIIEDMLGTSFATLQDRNVSPATERVYEGQGNLLSMTSNLADAINDGDVYVAELLTSPAFILMPSENDEEEVDSAWFDAFTNGSGDGEPTNADYLAGLEATKAKTDTSWIHAVGATTDSLWTAVLLHCDEMAEDHHAERFAILETPEFESDFEEGSAEYLADLQEYVDAIVTRMAMVGDRNACVFAGGAEFLDSDGEEHDFSIVSACGGTMAGLEVQKSLINKPVKGVLRLVPEFPPGHIQTLIQNRVNCLRFKPGRGFIIAHSLTAAAEGSDYSRVNDLRAVYYGSKAARDAAQPYVGEENDRAGEGLRKLESAMARPLEQMRDAGQIDDFELSAVSTEQDRLLGDVYVSLGIQPRRAMEMIYTTVYLK